MNIHLKSKWIFSIFGVCLILNIVSLDTLSANTLSRQFDDFFLHNHLSWENYSKSIVKPSLDLYIEDYFDFGIANLNATGGFTAPDGESYSVHGSPSRWIRFFDHGFDISDLFFVGTSLHKLELNFEDIYIDSRHPEISVSNVFGGKHYVGLDGGNGSFIYDNLSSSRIFQEFILGKKGTHAVERIGSDLESLLANRRRVRKHLEFTQNYQFNRINGKLLIKNFNQFGKRSLINFDHKGIAGTYDEDYLRLNLQLLWLPDTSSVSTSNKGFINLPFHLRYTHLNRSHLYAENYFSENETAQLEMDNISAWWNIQGNQIYQGTHGLNLSRKLIDKHVENFSKNIIDQDGTGMEPWYPSAEVIEVSQNNKVEHFLNIPFLDRGSIGWKLNQSILHLKPFNESNQSAIYYKTTSTNTALYIRKTSSKAFTTYFGHLNAGVNFSKSFFDQLLHVNLGVKGVLDVMALPRRSLILPDIEYHLDLELTKSERFYTSISFGQKSIPLSSELALFISKDYDSGVFNYWRDDNGDLNFQEREDTGVLYRPTGGEYVELDTELKHPSYIYLDWPIKVRIGKTFGISLTFSYRTYMNLFDVKWKDNASRYGHYDSVTSNSTGTKSFDTRDAQQVYILDQGDDIKYILSHDEDYPNLGSTFLTERPFYAGAYLEGVAKGPRYYVSISFNAYMIMGRSGFGNGYKDNTLGSLSEEKANPNSNIRSIGRMNNDNGYTSKITVNGELFKGFFVGMVIKYRDGEAFSHYLTYITNTENGNQAAVWKRDVNGDTLLFPKGEFGTREDAFWNLDLNFIYNFSVNNIDFRAYFQVINVFDMGAEIAEKIFDPNRSALELQNPRGFRLGLFTRF